MGNSNDDSFDHPRDWCALVWVPAVIVLFLNGQHLTATLLLVWCAAVVGTIDNFLRPVTRRPRCENAGPSHSDWHPGRIVPFGPIGFIVGPIICGLFLTVWDIYGATFKKSCRR